MIIESKTGVEGLSLLPVADRRLVIGYLESGQVRLVDRNLLRPRPRPFMNDGPDPIGSGGPEGEPPEEDRDDRIINDEHEGAEGVGHRAGNSGRGGNGG